MIAPSPLLLVNPRDPQAEARLAQELNLPILIAALLVQRGYREPEAAEKFLNPSLEDLHDPRLLPDYDEAAKAILGARERGELIFVHGDYDVDGVTSAAILGRFLQKIGCKVHTHVPHRMKEGYGINRSAVSLASEMGAALFLTCDCGISAHDQVAQAREAGMAVVVTDHHSIGLVLPDAQAVVNPHRTDSHYPFHELSGAGVAFKLCAGLTQELGHNIQQFYRAYLDLVALGTIADVMPLVGENRILAKFGLERLSESKKPGIRALMEVAGITPTPDKPLKASHVGWQLGPRLNAAGRIDDSSLSLQLLLATEDDEAKRLALELEQLNQERKTETVRIVEEANDQAVSEGLDEHYVIVVASEKWHPGIVGIAAGRLTERYSRPCFVLAGDPESETWKGSARGIPAFNLAEAIRAHPDLFLSGGGHAMAAGCSISKDRLQEMRTTLDQFARERLTPDDLRPREVIDLEVEPGEVTFAAAEALSTLEPFGAENPEPTFLARDACLAQIMPTKNPIHARVVVRHGASTAKGIAFQIGESLTEAGAGSTGDLVFSPGINEYMGSRSLQWQVRSFAPDPA